MRWLAAHLPWFALDVHGRAGAEGPLAVAGETGTRRRVMACNAAAAAGGVRAGMSVNAAHALVPGLRVMARDAAAEGAALANLAAWAGQFSDLVSIEAGQGLVLESGRSLRLFGGGRRLGQRVAEGLAGLGYRTRVALAPTARGAWWLALAGGGACVAEPEALRRRLLDLPLAVMELPPRAAADLAALGLATVGDLAAQPRQGLSRRLGPALLRQLDEALGRRPEARRGQRPPPDFHGRLELPAPIQECEALLFPLRRLLLELAGMLRGRTAGVTRFEARLDHGGGRHTAVTVGLAMADDDGERFLELLRQRLERVELDAPVEAVAVAAADIQDLAPITGDLFGAPGERDARREAGLVGRLRARLGEEAVRGLAEVPDHRPERAWRPVTPAIGVGDVQEPRSRPPRPRWLLAEPRPLAGRGAQDLRLVQGPERIEGGWWDGHDVSRDYYVAEAPGGRRLWVFHDRRPPHGWYVHGLFG